MERNTNTGPVGTPRGWYYGWNIVGLTVLFQALSIGIIFYTFALLVLPLAEEFSVSRTKIMMVLTSMQIVMGLLGPFAGKIVDSLPLRPLLCFGMAAIGGGLLLLSQVQAYWQLPLVYGLILSIGGFLAGPIVAQSLVVRWFNDRQGLALGISTLGTSIGGLIFPLLFAFCIASGGWRFGMMVMAAIVLAFLPVCWIVLRRSPPEEKPGTKLVETETVTVGDFRWSPLQVIRSRHFWIFMGCILPLPMVFIGIQINLVAYSHDLGYSESQGASLLSALFVGMILGKLFVGYVSDKTDLRWVFWTINVIFILMILALVSEPEYPYLMAISVVIGAAAGGALPLTGATISRVFGVASFGTVFGVYAFFGAMTTALAPITVSSLQAFSGSYNIAFVILLCLLVPAAIMALFLPTQPISISGKPLIPIATTKSAS